MRVLALVTDAFGGGGGIAQYNRDLLRAVAEHPAVAAVDVLPLVSPSSPVDCPARVSQQPAPRGRAAYVAQALRLAAMRSYDTIFCGHLNLAPLAAALAALRRIPFVVQVHGIEVWSALSVSRRRALERAEGILCVSRDTRRRVLAAGAIAPDRVHVLPNTVDPRYTPGDRPAARRRFGLASEKVLLTVGRLDAREAYKGHDRVIAALPRLRAAVPDIIYVIGGDGDDRSRLETLVAKTGVTDAVRFLGFVPNDALADLYRAADAFVMPSTGEGFGIVYLEAMACGTPAIGLAAGGAPDALGDGHLGLVAGEGDLADVILASLASAQPPGALADAVTRRFGWRNFAGQVHALVPSWQSSPPQIAPRLA